MKIVTKSGEMVALIGAEPRSVADIVGFGIMSPFSVYQALRAMRQDGLVKEAGKDSGLWTLTKKGERALEDARAMLSAPKGG